MAKHASLFAYAGLMHTSIQRLKVDDTDQALQLETRVVAFPWTRAVWEHSLQKDWAIGVRHDGHLAAVAVFSLVADEVTLLNIAVAREYQGQGLARRLLSHGLEYFAARGGRECFLEVRESNRAAKRLYRKFGFEKVGQRRNYYPSEEGSEDACVMACDIQAALAQNLV